MFRFRLKYGKSYRVLEKSPNFKKHPFGAGAMVKVVLVAEKGMKATCKGHGVTSGRERVHSMFLCDLAPWWMFWKR